VNGTPPGVVRGVSAVNVCMFAVEPGFCAGIGIPHETSRALQRSAERKRNIMRIIVQRRPYPAAGSREKVREGRQILAYCSSYPSASAFICGPYRLSLLRVGLQEKAYLAADKRR
jgi:hypothetical protein